MGNYKGKFCRLYTNTAAVAAVFFMWTKLPDVDNKAKHYKRNSRDAFTESNDWL
jgi:hypothetical protein